MRPHKYLLDLFYVVIICNMSALLIKLKKQLNPARSIGHINKTKMPPPRPAKTSTYKRAAKLYLNDKYLRVVKSVEPTVDSKSIVDRATKRPLELVLAELARLDESNHDEIREFVAANFHEPGVEIVEAQLSDWSPHPEFLKRIRDERLRLFSSHLNATWLDLCRKFDSSVIGEGCVSSHLEMRHSFVVPGGRFREIYYWDTYWTLEGLFVCGLFETAQKVLENFIQFIDDYGFIPNGSRIYYLNRSQPPYFSQMVARYYELCGRDDPAVERFVLDEALPRMIREYEFWMNKRSVPVRLSTSKSSRVYRLNLYKVNTTRPRPESYHEDLTTAVQSSKQVYRHIASAAESGYDFSSRWLSNSFDFSSIQTSEIIPVDLNAIIFKNETIIGDLLERKGEWKTAALYRRRAARRRFAMNKLMWSRRTESWCDYNLRTGRLNTKFYISNLSPLWMGMTPPKYTSAKSVLLKHEPLLEGFQCGVPVSMIATDQQWDYHNVWAPNQHSMVVMLMGYDRDAALRLARKFFSTVYEGWLQSGAIFEKYDVREVGKRGRGGEYEVQSGFGWTNGVVLALIDLFGDELVQS